MALLGQSFITFFWECNPMMKFPESWHMIRSRLVFHSEYAKYYAHSQKSSVVLSEQSGQKQADLDRCWVITIYKMYFLLSVEESTLLETGIFSSVYDERIDKWFIWQTRPQTANYNRHSEKQHKISQKACLNIEKTDVFMHKECVAATQSICLNNVSYFQFTFIFIQDVINL